VSPPLPVRVFPSTGHGFSGRDQAPGVLALLLAPCRQLARGNGQLLALRWSDLERDPRTART